MQLENASDGGLIYIQDRSSACKRTTSLQVKNYEFDFDVCSIKYVSFQHLKLFYWLILIFIYLFIYLFI